MGKRMRAGCLKTKDGVVSLTRAQLKEYIDSGVSQAFLIMLAYLMEEPEFNCDADRIIGFWDGVNRYAECIKDHTITLKQVTDIVNEHTGLGIKLLGK